MGITFICSIRGSKQKYFCADEKDMDGMGQNIPAGTVVAGYGNGVPESYSFHLASQAACGTVNPTFYQVIHDDNSIELQNCSEMTYALSRHHAIESSYFRMRTRPARLPRRRACPSPLERKQSARRRDAKSAQLFQPARKTHQCPWQIPGKHVLYIKPHISPLPTDMPTR